MNDDELLKSLHSIDFWLGAIASNLQLANRLKAKEMGINCVWWDPTVEPWPKTQKHKDKAEVTEILVGIPRQNRAKAFE